MTLTDTSIPPAPAVIKRRVHIEALDGLRGIAAVSVMLNHAYVGNSHGYLMVDFFFCLSGFVIAMAYENRLAEGLSLPRYMGLRIMRVWPMLFIGGILGLALLAYNPEAGPLKQANSETLAMVFLANSLLIPFYQNHLAFVLNNSQWSIVYELLANLIHAAGRRVLGARLLVALVVVSGLYLAARVMIVGTANWGYDTHFMDIALARTLYSFFLGILIFRYRERIAAVLPAIGFWWLAAALLTLASIHAITWPFAWLEPLRQLATAMAVNPVVVCLALNCGPQSRLVQWLGTLSFPLYAIHEPVVHLFAVLLEPMVTGYAFKLAMLAGCGAIAVFALWLGLFADLPLNRWRKRHFG